MNMPTITAETPLPTRLRLTQPGEPLEGLKGGKIGAGHIRDTYALYASEDNGRFWVMTVGHTPQTKREHYFRSKQEMLSHVNNWLRDTIKRGLALRELQRATRTGTAID